MRTPLVLRYGRGTRTLSFPAGAPVQEHGLRAASSPGRPPATALREALAPLAVGDFAAAARGRHVGLLLSDGTRGDPHRECLAACLELCGTVGVATVSVFVCTGTHDPGLPENRALADELTVAAASFPRVRVHLHDCQGPTLDRGQTRRGTRVRVDALTAEVDAFLVVSDVKNHYFAGYSNPVKSFVPGLCDFETARGNHSLALDPAATFGRHPWHPEPGRRTNPLAEDMVEALEMVLGGRPAFALCLFTRDGAVSWAQAGPIAGTAGRAMEEADRWTSRTVTPAARVIVSAGGHPTDESLYTAQRALELTRDAVAPGGEILFLAECRNGIGSALAVEGFYDRLRPDLDAVLASFGGEYTMYSHKAYRFALLLQRVAAVRMVSALDADVLEAIHLHREQDPQAVLDRWLQETPTGPVLVFHDAGKLAVYAA